MKTIITIEKISNNFPLFRAMADITANTPEKEARRFRLDCIQIKTTYQNNRENYQEATVTDGRALFNCVLYPTTELEETQDGLYRVLANTAAGITLEYVPEGKLPDSIPYIIRDFTGLPYAGLIANSSGMLSAGLNWLSGRDFIPVHDTFTVTEENKSGNQKAGDIVEIFNQPMGINPDRLNWFDRMIKKHKGTGWDIPVEVQRKYNFDQSPDNQIAKFRIVGSQETGLPGFWQAVVVGFLFHQDIIK